MSMRLFVIDCGWFCYLFEVWQYRIYGPPCANICDPLVIDHILPFKCV